MVLVWFGKDLFGLVWFGWYSLVWGGGGCQMTSEFIYEEISMLLHMIDYFAI